MKKVFAPVALSFVLLTTAFIPANADSRDYYRDYYGGRYYRDNGFLSGHPYIKKAVLVGGAGAAIGALVSQDGRRVNGAVKGALIGAGAGVGYEYLRRKGHLSW